MVTAGQGVGRFLGPRTWKTGIAVTLAVWLSCYVPYSLPLLAGVAAVICLQPSITVGLKKGITRIQATILGGLFGLVLLHLFGSHPLLMGAGVVVIIWICNQVKWGEGIVLASVTLIAVIYQAAGEAVPYALGRVISTLIGIIVATAINILVAPPRHHVTFREELRRLTASFPDLYVKAVQAYASNRMDLSQEVLLELAEAEKKVEVLRGELSHLRAGTQTRFGTYLEGIELREYILFERGVHFLNEVMAKIRDLVEVAQRRYWRKQELLREGKIRDPYKLSPEFEDLLAILQELAVMLGRLHQCVFRLVGERELALMSHVHEQAGAIHRLQEQVRERLKSWQVEHIREVDILILMSANRVIFDLEEIVAALTDLARAAVSANGAEKKTREEKLPLLKGRVEDVLGDKREREYRKDSGASPEAGPGDGH